MSDEEIISRLGGEKKKKKISPDDCYGVVKLSKKYVTVILIIMLITIVPLFLGVIKGLSAVIDIEVNPSQINLDPTQPIKIERDTDNTHFGRYAFTNNATFNFFGLEVMILYPATNAFLDKEFYQSQFPDRIISTSLNDFVTSLDSKTDFFLSQNLIFFSNNSSLTQLKYRISADYSIAIRIQVFINFTIPNERPVRLSFLYSENHDRVSLLGKPLGITSFPLVHGSTFKLNITNMYYDYQYINRYFGLWGAESDIPPYPFIVNATKTNSFNWNDFWGVTYT